MSTSESELARGWQLHQQRRVVDAERIYRDVLAREPQSANAWCYLGIALNDQRRYAQAVEAYQRALSLNPRFPIALNNLGNSLRYLGEIQRADQSFQQAIELKPDYFNAYKNRGTLHAWSGQLDLALKYYSQALELNPRDAELHRNLGVIYLLQGNFAQGWAEYRWRWQVGDLQRVPGIPVWDGSDPSGKTLLLTVEQGLGDTLHFVRFAKLLRQRGAKTLVYCQPSLLALLQASSSLGLGSFYPNNLPLTQAFDFQCSLLDVADLMQVDLPTIPSMSGYLQATESIREYWKRRLPPSTEAFRVGIAWQGNRDHQADMYRSIPLTYFERLSQLPSVQLISLQQGFGTEQLASWKGQPLVELGAAIDQSSGAFMDTAAIMPCLDLVITSDTSIAHLAGGLGVPTWIGLNYIPDWRWLLDRRDSPWYPSVRLFRQPTTGDWESVFAAMATALAELPRGRQ